ncbi:MAG: EAL domain-containing protein [Lachnospiraceae bacterium]|jgi:EAL domain-containing protein (putative c-di-GMP-specific phosphodiesterase class I)|nr:EAL domain-containing protein [Lachnospiraceae bacterium]
MTEQITFFSYVNYLDIAAIVISSILAVLYLYRKIYFTKQGNLFLALAIVNIFMAVGSICYRVIENDPSHGAGLRYFLNIVCTSLTVTHLTLYFFYVYNISKNKDDSKKSPWGKVIPIIATIVILILITNPFTKWFANMDEPGEMIPGPLYFAIFVQAILTFIIIIYMNITATRVISKNQSVVLWANIVLVLALMFLKVHFSVNTADSFINSLIVVILFTVLENPSYFLYENGVAYNENAFYQAAGRFVKGNSKWVVFVGLEEKDYVNRLLPKEKITKIHRDFADKAHSVFKKEMLFYLGKSSFAVFTSDDADEVATKLINTYIEASHSEDESVGLTPYAGYLSFEDVNNADTLRKAKDIFDSRKKSANTMVRISRITSIELDRRRREIAVIRAIRKALEEDTLQVFYQPIFFAKSNQFEAAEALVRLRDEDLGNISPKEFLPLAEENGLIIPLGEAVFRKVCEFIRTSDVRRLGVSFIEINMSLIQCLQYDMADRIISILSEYEVEPGLINLEISESAYKVDKEMVVKNVTKLRNYGVSFSLDDFGAGFANAEYISTIPVMFVNLAIELVTSAMEDRNSLIILKNYVSLIKDLRYGCIAKGVESTEMVESMKDIGCDAFQGYYYSRAMNEEDFIRYILKRE